MGDAMTRGASPAKSLAVRMLRQRRQLRSNATVEEGRRPQTQGDSEQSGGGVTQSSCQCLSYAAPSGVLGFEPLRGAILSEGDEDGRRARSSAARPHIHEDVRVDTWPRRRTARFTSVLLRQVF